MSAAGRALSKALDTPSDWQLTRYTAKHNPTGQKFWIANGGFFFDGYTSEGTPECLGLLERHWLYRKTKNLGAALVAAKFAAA